ncbi:MAG: hypothetical protein PHQ91_02720 [Thermoanaerobaculaceae bacterium]|nr:hypothetical protein [Thermoanaerobaculaceae bacterium]TAM44418.1 MAG: hypothetical protein EPN53_16535 [Acidobacteriota bacterium]
MSARWRVIAALAVPLAALLAGCDRPRVERPLERVTRLRLLHKVAANWFEMQKDPDGKPVLVMDLTVTNDGNESLRAVTMRLHVTAPDGKDRLVMPLTLDVAQIKPGTLKVLPPRPGRAAVSEVTPGPPGHLVVRVPGVDVKPGEEVTLEMEGQPTKQEMATYPEYRGVS